MGKSSPINQQFDSNYSLKQFHRKMLKDLWRTAKWPDLPSPDSDLYIPACDLMELDTYLAGCFQQIIDTGQLPEAYHHLLYVNDDLTLRLSASKDDRKDAYVFYKRILDDCVMEARRAIHIQDTSH